MLSDTLRIYSRHPVVDTRPCRSHWCNDIEVHLSLAALPAYSPQQGMTGNQEDLARLADHMCCQWLNNQTWESHKLEIKRLYLKQNKTLVEVMHIMKTSHNFCEPKFRYEAKFKEWGFRKNRGGAAKWRVIKERLKKRKTPGEVYIDGILQPPEKVRVANNQQTFRSTMENIVSEHSPKTPDGVFICSPGPSFEWKLQWPSNLPWFVFSRMEPLRNLKASFALSSSEISYASRILLSTFTEADASVFSIMSSVLRWKTTNKLQHVQSTSRAAATLGVIMPETHEGQHLEVAEKLCDMPEQLPLLLQLTFFMLSNNIRFSVLKSLDLKGSKYSISGEDIFVMRILRTAGLDNLKSFKNLLCVKQSTAEALAESLFKSALRSLDIQIIKIILEAGMSPYTTFGPPEHEAINSFEFAASLYDYEMAIHIIKIMLSHSPIPCPKPWLTTALESAVSAGNEDLVWLLVSAGANITPSTMSLVMSSWIKITQRARIRLVQFFVKDGGDIEFQCEHRTFLGFVGDDTSFTRMLINLGAHIDAAQEYVLSGIRGNHPMTRTNPLGIAAACGHTAVMQMLLTAGANVNPGPDSGIDIPPLVVAIHEKQIKAARLLLSNGADVSTANRFQDPKEHWKAQPSLFKRAGSNVELHTILLAAGDQPDYQAIEKNLHTHLLESIEKHEVESFASLLALGALMAEEKSYEAFEGAKHKKWSCWCSDPNQPLPLKAFPLAVKVGNCEIVSSLISARAVPHDVFVPWIGNLQTAILLAHSGLLVGISNPYKQEPIVSSILRRDAELTSFLLSYIGDLRMAPSPGTLHLSEATCYNPLEAALCLGDIDLARALISQGASFTELELNALIWKVLQSGSEVSLLELWDQIPYLSGAGATAFAMIMQARDLQLFQRLLEAGVSLRGEPKVLFQLNENKRPEVIYRDSTPVLGGFAGKGSTLGWWNFKTPMKKLMAQPLSSLLEAAVLFDDCSFLKLLLDRGEWDRDEKGKALTRSLICNSMSLFQVLLDHGADVHQEVPSGKTREFYTDSGSAFSSYIDPVCLSLERGEFDLLQKLIHSGLDTDSYLIQDGFALSIAIDRGDCDLVQCILSLQTRHQQQHEHRKDFRTHRKGRISRTSFIGSIKDKRFHHHLERAIKDNKLEVAIILLESGAYMSYPALEAAMEKQDLNFLNTLFINMRNSAELPKRLGAALQWSVDLGNMEITDYLLKAGANVNQKPALQSVSVGGTALQIAASHGYIGIAHKLICAGANVKAPSYSSLGYSTALEEAAQNGHIDMLQFLLNTVTFIEYQERKAYIRAILLAEYNGFIAASRLLISELCWFDSDQQYYNKKKLDSAEFIYDSEGTDSDLVSDDSD